MAFLFLIGCESETPGTESGGREVVNLGPLTALVDATIPTVYSVSWEEGFAGTERFIEYGRTGAAFDRRTNALPGTAGKVIGLTGGQSWDLRAVEIAADGERGESEVLTVEVIAPPSELQRFVSFSTDPGWEPNLQGLHFVSVIQDGNAWVTAVDENGEYAWWLESENNRDIDALHTSVTGTGLLYTHFGTAAEDVGIGHIQFDGSGAHYTLAAPAHLDARDTTDGTHLFLGGETLRGVTLEDGTTTDLRTDTVRRIPAGSTEAETLFTFGRSFPHPFYRTCEHFDEERPAGGFDFSHINSLMVDEAAGEVIILSKNLDALIAIDMQTGEYLWQIGGRWSNYTDVDGDQPPTDDRAWQVDGPNRTWWSHAHMSDYWGDGMLVFDNGAHHADRSSRVVEYRIDHSARTIEKVNEWPSPSGTHNPALGDGRRLPNGNRLLAFMIEGRLVEVTPEGETLWDFGLELGAGIGRITHVPDIYAGQPTAE